MGDTHSGGQQKRYKSRKGKKASSNIASYDSHFKNPIWDIVLSAESTLIHLFSKVSILDSLGIENLLLMPQGSKGLSFRIHINSQTIPSPKPVLRPLNHVPVLVLVSPHAYLPEKHNVY